MEHEGNVSNKNDRSQDDIAEETANAAYRRGISPEEVIKMYSNWAIEKDGTYEEYLNGRRYKGPQIAADTVLKYLNGNKTAKILDVAAGTGFVGQKLQRLGFMNIDALEPAEGMLQIAKTKNVYSRFIQDYLKDGKTDIGDDVYDCLVIAGGMGEGHIPVSALKEMVRVVKPGGYAIIVMRELHLIVADDYRDRLEPVMVRMESQGLWSRQERTVHKNYFLDQNGIAFVFKIHVSAS